MKLGERIKSLWFKWIKFLLSQQMIFVFGGIAIVIAVLCIMFPFSAIIDFISDFYALIIWGILIGGSTVYLIIIAVENTINDCKKKKK